MSSIATQSSQKHYAKFGRCQNIETGKTRCAMTPEDCESARNENGERWYNDAYTKQKGIDDGDCKCENTLMGACVSVVGKNMNYECAPRTKTVEEDYCLPQDDVNGILLDPTYEILPTNTAGTNCFCDALQSIEDDTIRNSPSSLNKYGACFDASKDEFFCAYSGEYCQGDHVWIHPQDVPDIRADGGFCTCEQTHIGGCVGGFHNFHCALSEEDCHWNSFVLPIDLKMEHNHSCLLCDRTVSLSIKPDEIVDSVEFDPSLAPRGLSFTAGISIGVAVTVIGLVLCGVMRYYARKDKTSDDNNTDNTSSSEVVPDIN